MTARTAFLILVIAAMAASYAPDVIARNFGLGREGLGMGKFGAAGSQGSNGIPPAPCTSTGIFNLSNVCNDIYFIGALK